MAKVEEIIKATSKITGVGISDIMSRRRDPKIIHARHIAMFLAHELTTLSYVSIGKAMDRDHTSIMYAIKKLNNRGRGKSKINTDMVKIKKLLAA
jgi:chromosomal replication initiator protein